MEFAIIERSIVFLCLGAATAFWLIRLFDRHLALGLAHYFLARKRVGLAMWLRSRSLKKRK